MSGNIAQVIKLFFISNGKKYVQEQNSFCVDLLIW